MVDLGLKLDFSSASSEPSLSSTALGIFGGLSKLWSRFGSPKLGPVLGPVL